MGAGDPFEAIFKGCDCVLASAMRVTAIPFLYRLAVLLSFATLKSWLAAKGTPLLFVLEALALAGTYFVVASFFVYVFRRLLKKNGAYAVGHNLAFILILSFQSAELISYWLQRSNINFTFFYHILELNLETLKIYSKQTIIVVLGFPLLIFITGKACVLDNNTLFKRFAFACFFLLPWNPMVKTSQLAYTYFWPTVTTLEKALVELRDRGVDTEALRNAKTRPVASFNSNSKNLILVYLESYEQKYIQMPGLTPNINSLVKDGALHFNNISQEAYTGWTIAGMFSSQCGLPLIVPRHSFGNDVMHTRANANFLCLGDILHEAGYHQTYFQGSYLPLAGVSDFYAEHGYNELVEVKNAQLSSQWGVHDSAVFDTVLKKATELANKHEPFNLTLATLDTHHPGMPTLDCPSPEGPYSKDLLLKAVHCTDLILGQFIDGLSRIPFSRDTLIFVLSDHLSMVKFVEYSDRKLLTFAVGKNIPSGPIEKSGSHFDIAPTLLELMGESPRIFRSLR